MLCPHCKKSETQVIDSRESDEHIIRRRRECLDCSHRFTTYEKIESPQVMVIKKDNTKQPFTREKIITGVYRACTNRPVPEIKIERLADEIAELVSGQENDEVTSKQIGDWVMERLKVLDEVAYLRFVSVYKGIGSAETFAKEIQKLNK